ncbi:MAG: exosortase/archaeosortase family protein, partial [Phycisphaerae bacterium]
MDDGQTVTRHSPQGSETGDAVREWDWNRILTPRIVFMMLPVVGLLGVAYAYPLMRWELTWRHNAAWSHGYLVPLLAVAVAHFRLKERPPSRIEPCIWGLGLILAGCVLRIWSRTMMFGYPGDATFLLVVAGIVLLVLGWDLFKAVWVSVIYLGLMIPWNVRYYEGVALPLQRFAAAVTERALWLFGYERVPPDVLRQWLQMHAGESVRWVSREVNVLNLASGPLTVAEACSGLHLLFAFVALGVLMAFMYRRAWWERVLIMVSSVPIAVLCNVVRVTLMAVASDHLHFERLDVVAGEGTWLSGFVLGAFEGGTVAAQIESLRQAVLNPDSWLHQSFGFAMLALAFGLMWLELRFIDLFLVLDEEQVDKPQLQPHQAERQ